ncbi:hypothetical protein K0M31_003490 [Melipona bicolor]|uniref:Uncharacterized protein n=1 Tax=Melipona bicolor TaxID=60889 RepID=A0AA40FZ29_9HYME|nr:hypothetical protein K0M31_003490 [Melipona bicolor]
MLFDVACAFEAATAAVRLSHRLSTAVGGWVATWAQTSKVDYLGPLRGSPEASRTSKCPVWLPG